MDIRFQNLGPEHWKGEVLLALACQGENPPAECPALDKAVPWLAVAPGMRDFKGKSGELALLHGHPELPVPRVLAVGLGPREKVDMQGIRKALAAAVQRCRAQGYTSLLLRSLFCPACPAGGSAWWKNASARRCWPCTVPMISKNPMRTNPRRPNGWLWVLTGKTCPMPPTRLPAGEKIRHGQ